MRQWVWELVGQPPAVPEVTVRVGERDARGRRGLTIHHLNDLDVTRAVERRTILVTNPLRTLVDVAGSVLPGVLTEAVDNALARRLVTGPGLEADGYAWHFSPEQKERDEARRNHLREAGWTVRVYTWRQVVQQPAQVAREITETYGRLSQPG